MTVYILINVERLLYQMETIQSNKICYEILREKNKTRGKRPLIEFFQNKKIKRH